MQRQSSLLLILAALSLAPASQLRAAVDFPYEYDFVSPDAGVSGKLFLDATSSTQGTAADIGPGSYLTFSLYGGYLPSVTFNLANLNTSLDPTLNFAWDGSRISTPLDFAVGLGQNDVLLTREFQNAGNQSPITPEYDVVRYFDVFAGANQNVLNGQSMNGSVVSLIASEATMDVGGGGLVYNVPFDSGTTGQWIALTVPEPAKTALLAALVGVALAILAGGKGRAGAGRTFLRMLLRRLPPNRG